MSIHSAAASAMPRLPVTWQEFSQLLRSHESTTRQPSESNPVERIESSDLSVQVRSHQSSDSADSSQSTDSKYGSWGSPKPHGSNGAESPNDSPHGPPDYSQGFEAWA